ncbi:L-lactate permease [Streptomyces sp. 891-h]|uniref:L-lactate permease n=1 Tax=Streptomyces sp. 891-h TaxID=2720714 RepID=UPI001FAB098C|nr:L-lactate permease [Streptomyces sp. 891-h]UNZ20978.1 hypothetical protein HC362_31745 [Streptomyces sp. 891-h]
MLGLITGLRRPAHWAAAAGSALAALLIWWLPQFELPENVLASGAGAGGVLVLNAAAVMLPGVYLSQVLMRREVHRSLQEWVRGLPLAEPAKVALVVVGIAPTVEALTGFGVSLLVTVPVLLALAPPATALRQAMLGMNIMPWGTLGLATAIGASLVGTRPLELGSATAVTSSLIFPLVAVWAALLTRPRQRVRTVVVAAALGGALSLGLLAFNRLGTVEVAGVLAGLTTTALGVLVLASRNGEAVPSGEAAHKGEAGHKSHALLPPRPVLLAYGLVLALIAVLRAATAAGLPPVALHAGGASFQLFSSPGLPLLATALLLDRGRLHGGDARAAAGRVLRPLLALTGFVALGQLMAAGGMIGELGAAVADAPPLLIALAAPALGILSGFITGSNVGGNALLMPLQERLAPGDGSLDVWFAALQNSAAGHAVFTSLPMIMLTLAVAGQQAQRGAESSMLRFGMRVACAVYAALAATATVLVLTAG